MSNFRNRSSAPSVDRQGASNYIDPMSIGIDVSLLPDSYRSVFESIPELRFSDNRSSLQKLGDSLGITNYYGTLRAQAEMDARSNYFQLLNMAREEEYNSPSAQASRMRDAGQNPDLLGTSGVSEASEFNEPQTHLQYQSPDFQGLVQFGSMFVSAFRDSLGIASAIQALKSNGLDLVQKEMSLSGSAYDIAEKIWSNLPTSTIEEIFSNEGSSDSSLVFNISDDTLAEYGVHSRKGRKAVRKAFQSLSGSYRGLEILRNSRKNATNARNEDISSRSQWFSGLDDKGMQKAMKQWNDFLQDVHQAQMKYQHDYYEVASGHNKGLAESSRDYNEYQYQVARKDNVQNEYNSLDASNRFNSTCINAKNKLISELLGNGDIFSRLLAIQLMSSSPMDVAGSVLGSAGSVVGAFIK